MRPHTQIILITVIHSQLSDCVVLGLSAQLLSVITFVVNITLI